MRVCMVAYTFYETDNRVRRYAETLANRGDHVEALALRRPGQPAYEVISGVHVYRIQRRVVNETGPLSYLLKLLSFLILSTYYLTLHHLRNPYSLVHVHSVPDFEVFSALVPRLTGAKVILDIHDIVPELYASKFKISHDSFAFRLLVWMEKLSGRFANHVIVANHLWYERLILRSIPAAKCTTILNYPDLRIFQPNINTGVAERSDFVLFYPGTLSWHQGADLLILAVARLREIEPQVRLVICGDGPERKKLESLVDEHQLRDRVTISGGVPIERVVAMMQASDLGVEPKRKKSFANEALSTKIFEFMAMGVPVLASDTIIHQRYFSGGLVEFFASEDLDDLVAAIARIIHDVPLRERLRCRGKIHIAENNWSVKRSEYLLLLDRMLEPSAGTLASTSAASDY